MKKNQNHISRTLSVPLFALALVLALGLPACELEVPDLNNAELDDFTQNPTAPTLAEACIGLTIDHRAGKAGGNGLVSILGVLGRESYNFDPADPRYITELLEGPELDSGSPAFGGNFWGGPYGAIRDTFLVENALATVPGLSDEELSATRGFAKTMRALEFLTIATTHYAEMVPLDVDRAITDELAPLESHDAAMAEIIRLLDEGADDLASGGAGFPFALHSGFEGMDTPAGFAQFNRGIRARVAAYESDWAGVMSALDGSFLSESPADLDMGAYHMYSTGAGDVTNTLSAPTLYVHPAVFNNAEPGDDRVARKTFLVDPLSVTGNKGTYTSSYRFAAYSSNVAPIPIIRNEELILLRAEAYIGMADYDSALADINFIRTNSGGLAGLPVGSLDAGNAVDELLHQRFYSLLFEGGHRWIDMRRYDRLDDVLLDDEADEPLTADPSFPLPLSEQAARGLVDTN